MALPGLIVTGASGFLGRRVLESLKEDYRIFGLARRSQARCGAPIHPNISWFQVDIGDREPLAAAFRRIRSGGGADFLLHLAAHYDFTGRQHPDYLRTNVEGLWNVVECSRTLGLGRFIYASSVAASAFPPNGQRIDESSPPDGHHIYSVTKRLGEAMLAEHRHEVPAVIIRFPAMFSDWCEYPPLFMFLGTWLSRRWNRRIPGGRGRFAVPYLHVRDAVSFIGRLLERVDRLPNGQVLIPSADGAMTVGEIYREATLHYFGVARQPLTVPKALCWVGVTVRDVVGRVLGERPFERPWMTRYIDRQLTVDARRTRQLLGWTPRPRLEIARRLPFLVENLKTDPVEWHRRNRAALRTESLGVNLRIHHLLEAHREEIEETVSLRLTSGAGGERFPSYRQLDLEEMRLNHRVALHELMNAVRNRDKSVFMYFCRDTAERRYGQGFECGEVCAVLQELKEVCLEVLGDDPEAADLADDLQYHIGMTMLFGCDEVEDTFDRLRETRARNRRNPRPQKADAPQPVSI